MKHKLSTQLSLGFALIVLATVALISLAANLLINHQFEKYVENQQKAFSDGLAEGLSSQYDAASGGWNLDYIHGFGMYALNDGYILQLYDAEKQVVWDAENHDMTLCHQIMNDISLRMKKQIPAVEGEFVTFRYTLSQKDEVVGYADISYYSPYYFNENAFHFVDSLNQILLAVGLLSLLCAAAAGVFLAKRISQPIVKTIEITREVADGNYAARLATEAPVKELHELTQSVNHMAEMLGEQDTLRKRLTTDLAHELRTPLANVSAHLEAIIEGVWEPTTERLQGCYEELRRLSGIVSDLERLRQIENENLKLHKEPVDLRALAETVRAAFESELAEKRLTCLVEGSAAAVPGDKERLQQVLVNLVSNAVKYSTAGGEIRIRLSDTPESAVLTVEDDGIGIAEADLHRIFERFYRTDRSRTRKTGGAGIGLTIAKAIIQAHEGGITAESAEGRGSRFIVTLPKARP